MKEFLPIGSVVQLKGTEKKLMVIGRVQICDGKVHKYSGVLYPEGFIGSDNLYLFEEADIERLYYVGMQDEEELLYRKALSESVKESMAAAASDDKGQQ